MSERIIVTGWGKDAGPAYTVVSSELDKKRNKRRTERRVVREQRGKSYTKPAWAAVDVGGLEYLLLNKGHEYNVLVNDEEGIKFVFSVNAVASARVIELDYELIAVGWAGNPLPPYNEPSSDEPEEQAAQGESEEPKDAAQDEGDAA